jgi:hypothetical protein
MSGLRQNRIAELRSVPRRGVWCLYTNLLLLPLGLGEVTEVSYRGCNNV